MSHRSVSLPAAPRPLRSVSLAAPSLAALPDHPALAALVGHDLVVPLAAPREGVRSVRYANLDQAASAPSLRVVADAIESLLPWYSSVHRGAGFASRVCSELLEAARSAVARFVGARADDVVVFTRNTTEALNLLAHAVPDGATVVSFASEHHANLLPWRQLASSERARHVELAIPRSAAEAVDAVDRALAEVRARAIGGGGEILLTVTGASNVTGELFPLEALVAVAQRHGARVAIDGAQLAPHRAVELAALGADWIALSGHKLYAPYGAGALVGRGDWLDAAPPWLAGGGAVRSVGRDAQWHAGPARHEAGTPNVLGAIALGAACRALGELGMDAVAAHEIALVERARRGLRAAGVEVLSLLGDDSARIGVVAFEIAGLPHGLVAAALSAEQGIGVRDGAFCAHPLVRLLAGERGGAVRASFGVGTTSDEVDRLVAAVTELAARGPRLRYRLDAGRWVPELDARALPELHPLLREARAPFVGDVSHAVDVPAPCVATA
jgi:selenocysteine lyase/cysteine desulfurase